MTVRLLRGTTSVPPDVVRKLIAIAQLLEVTPTIEERGYDWATIDALLFDPGVQDAIHA